jgi:formamidopyrimidine-DNA glycosylase
MPELPEAEVSRQTLVPCVEGKTVNSVLVARPQSIRTPLLDDALFKAWLKDRRGLAVERRAKALVFRLDAGKALVFHFKLGADVLCRDEPVSETNGVALDFTDGTSLEFANLALSEFHLVDSDRLDDVEILKGGAEPLERSFTLKRFSGLLPANKQLKAAITDQGAIAGIGNAWADEILWNARLSPFRKVSELSDAEVRELHAQIRKTLRAGIKAGGEGGFLDARGRPSRYETVVHGHEGSPCPRDGHAIEMVKKGRKTYWCPECQI